MSEITPARAVEILKNLNFRATGETKQANEMAIGAIKTYLVPKLAEWIESSKFQCPKCYQIYDACYDKETGEPKSWFNFCPECGQFIQTKEVEGNG